MTSQTTCESFPKYFEFRTVDEIHNFIRVTVEYSSEGEGYEQIRSWAYQKWNTTDKRRVYFYIFFRFAILFSCVLNLNLFSHVVKFFDISIYINILARVSSFSQGVDGMIS